MTVRHEEDGDQAAGAGARSRARGGRSRGSIRLSTTLRSERMWRQAGPMPACMATCVYPLSCRHAAPPAPGTAGPAPRARRGAARQGPVGRSQEQRLGLADRARGRCGQGGDQVGDRARRARRAGTAVSASPMLDGLRGADHPCRRADLQCPGVANALDQRLCSRQVRHQARARTPSCRTARRRRPPAGRRRAPAGSRRRWRSPGPRRCETKRGSRSQVKPCWKSSMVALIASSSSARRPATVSVAGGARVEHRAGPGRRRTPVPAPRTTTTRTSSGSPAPIAAQRVATSRASARCATSGRSRRDRRRRRRRRRDADRPRLSSSGLMAGV